MTKPICIGIGEILWDEFPEGRKLGGAPANFSFHTRQMGADSSIISAIGDDEDGKVIKRILNEKKISHYLSVDTQHPTGKVSVKLDKTGSAQYVIHEHAAWDFIYLSSESFDVAKNADAVCFGTLANRNAVSAASIKNFIGHTSDNCMKIFDINLRQNYYSKSTITGLLKLANIVKLNSEELNIVTCLFNLPENENLCLRALKEMFSLEYIILTKGGNGSRIFKSNAQDSVLEPEKKIKVIDSVGAGDSYTAAVTIGLINDLDLEKINITASKIAAFVCMQNGATPTIPANLIQQLYKSA